MHDQNSIGENTLTLVRIKLRQIHKKEKTMAIEVFKTNITNREHANMLIAAIVKIDTNYVVNFDLDDCDRILRVKNKSGIVEVSFVIELLKDYGFIAEVLPDSTGIEHDFDKPLRLTYN
jgi:hypothetical protein